MPPQHLGDLSIYIKKRFDIFDNASVLGSTLFSQITPSPVGSDQLFVSDFSNIETSSVNSHCSVNRSALNWLNTQGTEIAWEETHLSVVIFTHQPNKNRQANDPKPLKNEAAELNSAFVRGLSRDTCGTLPQVGLWAFFHTHFNCDLSGLNWEKGSVKLGRILSYRETDFRRYESGTCCQRYNPVMTTRMRTVQRAVKRQCGYKKIMKSLNLDTNSSLKLLHFRMAPFPNRDWRNQRRNSAGCNFTAAEARTANCDVPCWNHA